MPQTASHFFSLVLAVSSTIKYWSCVPIANPVCGRICAGGNGRGFEGMWPVGFKSEAACFAPLLAPWICRWRAHGGSVIKQAHVGAHLSPSTAQMEPYEIQAARRSYRW